MNARLAIAGILGAVAVFTSTSDAHAAGQPNGFGEKGQLILSADRLVPLFNYTSVSVTRVQNNVELTDSRSGAGISLLFGRSFATEEGGFPMNVHTLPRVAFDVTIIPRLTLGAAIAFGFGLGGSEDDENLQGGVRTTRTSDGATATAIGFGPRVGYVLPLGELFAFWPRLGFSFYSISVSREELTGAGGTRVTKESDTFFSLDLDPQFALVPFEHFFIHGGPLVNIPLSGSRDERSGERVDTSVFNFGLSLGLGGWFNVF